MAIVLCVGIEVDVAENLHPDDGVDEEEDAHQEADIGQGLSVIVSGWNK